MKPYGVKRNWNAVESNMKGGHAESPKSHSITKKLYHRIARRAFKHWFTQLRSRGTDKHERDINGQIADYYKTESID